MNKKMMSPVKLIALSFILLIFVGSLLLSLPFASKVPTGYLNHLFISTSASCVTGLVTVTPCEQYTLFGQIIILLLIQIGGLGFLTLLMVFYTLIDKRLKLSDKITIQQALNIASLNGISHYLLKVIQYTLVYEGLGWIFLTIGFSRYYPLPLSIWYGFFHSISAFCNAGFDLLGSSSLMIFQYDLYMNLVFCALIILGGLGFIVHLDLENKIRAEYERYQKGKIKYKYHFSIKRFMQGLALQTKIVLMMTAFLTVLGMVGFFVLESNHALVNESFGHSMLLSFFQSVTLRTAGFSTMDYASLKDATKLFMCVFMMIGGSPAGTAGGIKSVTIFIILLSLYHSIKNERDTHVFNYSISKENQSVAHNLFVISMVILFVMTMLLSIVDHHHFIDILFEIFSAFGTVGITAGITSTLTNAGKVVIIVLMYIGRIGPITMVLNFITNHKKSEVNIQYPEGNILIG